MRSHTGPCLPREHPGEAGESPPGVGSRAQDSCGTVELAGTLGWHCCPRGRGRAGARGEEGRGMAPRVPGLTHRRSRSGRCCHSLSLLALLLGCHVAGAAARGAGGSSTLSEAVTSRLRGRGGSFWRSTLQLSPSPPNGTASTSSSPPVPVSSRSTGSPPSGSQGDSSNSGSGSSTPTWAIAVITVLGVLFLASTSLAAWLFLRLQGLRQVLELHSAEPPSGGPGVNPQDSGRRSLVSIRKAVTSNGRGDANTAPLQPATPSATKSRGASDFGLKVAENFVKAISLEELQEATNNFAESNALGSGGYGTVYKGVGPGGVLWAVKRAKNAGEEGVEDFQNEVDVISKMSHRNLVKLLGYCDEGKEQILVYEFVPNGTLRQHIRPENPNQAPLTFQQRLEIAVGAAEGLKYLHSFAEPAIIHRDIKCDNILLDMEMQAKVADFGVFKRSPTEAGKTMNTRVVGTPGYVDPEYYQTYKVTVKSDVYSFGVVLLELITGRPPIMEDPSVENESYMVTLSRWATPKIANGKVDTIVDPRLLGSYPRQALNMMAAITAMCVRRLGRDRPEMAEVATRLAEIKYFLKPSSGVLEPVMNLFPEDREDGDNLLEIPEEENDDHVPEHIPGTIPGINPYATTDLAAPVSMVFSDR